MRGVKCREPNRVLEYMGGVIPYELRGSPRANIKGKVAKIIFENKTLLVTKDYGIHYIVRFYTWNLLLVIGY